MFATSGTAICDPGPEPNHQPIPAASAARRMTRAKSQPPLRARRLVAARSRAALSTSSIAAMGPVIAVGKHFGELGLRAVLVADDARRRRAGDLRLDAELALDLAQAIEHLARIDGPVVGGLLGRPQHQLVELLGDAGVLDARPGHGVGRVLEGDLHGLLALIGLLAREHLVEHDAERVDVAAGIGHAARHELGGEVGDRAEQLGAGRGVRRRRSRQTEVADLDPAVLREQHVLGLDVAVHDPGAMRRREAREDRIHDRDRLRRA